MEMKVVNVEFVENEMVELDGGLLVKDLEEAVIMLVRDVQGLRDGSQTFRPRKGLVGDIPVTVSLDRRIP